MIGCLEIQLTGDVDDFSSETWLTQNNFTVDGVTLVRSELLFSVKAVRLRPEDVPECYRFDLRLVLDNEDQDGQLPARLDSDAKRSSCQGDNESVPSTESRKLRSCLNVTIIIISLLSLVLCARAVIKAQLLKWVIVSTRELPFTNWVMDEESDTFCYQLMGTIILNLSCFFGRVSSYSLSLACLIYLLTVEKSFC